MSHEVPAAYMLDLRLDAARILKLGSRRGLTAREVDPGYLVHCQLRELFGAAAPHAFQVTQDHGRHWRVLAYAHQDHQALKAAADGFAEPTIHVACDWEAFASKRMPDRWVPETVVGFEVRACPTVRMARADERHREGAEVDAFLARCWAVGPDAVVDREAVYREWLGSQFDRFGGVRLLRAEIAAIRRVRLIRRTQGENRQIRVPDRPEVVFKGELAVTEDASFRALLERGIGRHRAFGFGMLLLRPPGR